MMTNHAFLYLACEQMVTVNKNCAQLLDNPGMNCAQGLPRKEKKKERDCVYRSFTFQSEVVATEFWKTHAPNLT